MGFRLSRDLRNSIETEPEGVQPAPPAIEDSDVHPAASEEIRIRLLFKPQTPIPRGNGSDRHPGAGGRRYRRGRGGVGYS